MTTLITGGSGKLGRELTRLLPEALAPTHREMDITDRQGIFEYLRESQVDTVIHCAAQTSVRYCEKNCAEAFRTNVQGTRNLCEALFSECRSGYFIYLSTACVFAGDQPEHSYSEDDIPYPKNFYGLTKLLGEYVVTEADQNRLSLGAHSLVIRTNFVERGKWKYPSVFVDRFGTYLYVDQVAGQIKKLVEQRTTGLVHVCGDKRMSMYELAHLTDPEVKPMTLKDYQGPPLTVNMCLTSKRILPCSLG